MSSPVLRDDKLTETKIHSAVKIPMIFAVNSLTENELLGLYERDSIGQKAPVAPFLFKAIYEYL